MTDRVEILTSRATELVAVCKSNNDWTRKGEDSEDQSTDRITRFCQLDSTTPTYPKLHVGRQKPEEILAQVQAQIIGATVGALIEPLRKLTATQIEAYAIKAKEKVDVALEQSPNIKIYVVAAGGVAILYKYLPTQIVALRSWNLSRRCSSLMLEPGDDLYKPLLNLISRRTPQYARRAGTVKTVSDLTKRQYNNHYYEDDDDDHYGYHGPRTQNTQKEQKKVRALPNLTILYNLDHGNGQPFVVDGESFWCTGDINGSLKIWHMSRSTDPIKHMLSKMYQAHQDKKYASTIPVFYAHIATNNTHTTSNAYWEEGKSVRQRDMDCLCLDPSVKKEILEDLTEYFDESTPSWYAQRGTPLRRGYLLYGPPGCGKSSLARAAASGFGSRILELSLSATGMTDDVLLRLMEKVEPKDILLIEDIDCAGIASSRKSRNPEDDDSDDTASSVAPTISTNKQQPRLRANLCGADGLIRH